MSDKIEPKLVDEFERELEELVKIVSEVIPTVREVRVFWSYNNGEWNQEKSDIDIYIKIEPKEFVGNRREISDIIKRRLSGKYKERFYFTIHSDHSGGKVPYAELPFFRDIVKSRTLYNFENNNARGLKCN